jgi:hypothetical protein
MATRTEAPEQRTINDGLDEIVRRGISTAGTAAVVTGASFRRSGVA